EDASPTDLRARLDLFDARGERVATWDLQPELHQSRHQPIIQSMPGLKDGWYRAALAVESDDETLATCDYVFVRSQRPPPSSGSFGAFSMREIPAGIASNAVNTLVDWLAPVAIRLNGDRFCDADNGTRATLWRWHQRGVSLAAKISTKSADAA